MTDPKRTRAESYKETLDRGDDVTQAEEVALILAEESLTAKELAERVSFGGTGDTEKRVDARLDYLLRRGLVYRDGTRVNESTGREAVINHLSPTGEQWLAGEIPTPERNPSLQSLREDVVDAARMYLRGEIDRDVLHLYVDTYDTERARRQDWTPPEEADDD